MAAAPVAADEAERLFADLAGVDRLGVAVSGGPDSTALLILLDRWRRRISPAPALVVLTVDHGLRRGSADEAAAVLALADRLGLPGERLVWDHAGAPPVADRQAAARAARYRLLVEAAGRHRLDAVALGHTLDDQAETVVMRLARGSGLRGRAGMAAVRILDGMAFRRPLLTVDKARLVATLEAAGVPYLIDPSNGDADRFLRARTRAAMPVLADLGLEAGRLADTARRLRRASAAIDHHVGLLADRAVTDLGGVARLDLAALAAAPDEVVLRLLADVVTTVRPAPYPPRAAALEDWLAAFRRPEGLRRRVLGGVVLDPRERGAVMWVHAEAGRRGFPVAPLAAGRTAWDGRFAITVEGDPPAGLTVAPAAGRGRRPDLPAAAAASLPMLVIAGEPILDPSRSLSDRPAGACDVEAVGAGWAARIEPLRRLVSSTKS